MRVLLDTNILARAAAGPPGPAHELFLRLTRHEHLLLWSSLLADELSRTLRYERVRAIHKLADNEIDEFVGQLMIISEIINPTRGLPPVISSDPDDDHVIQTAIAGRANVLCTRDRHLLQPKVVALCEGHGIRALNDIDLLSELRKTKAES